jgi:hypothetical protein
VSLRSSLRTCVVESFDLELYLNSHARSFVTRLPTLSMPSVRRSPRSTSSTPSSALVARSTASALEPHQPFLYSSSLFAFVSLYDYRFPYYSPMAINMSCLYMFITCS